MVSGYVVFADESAFAAAHANARTALGLPRVGRRQGRLDPTRQQTVDVTQFRTNVANPGDPTVMTYVDDRFWPESERLNFTFLRRVNVEDYFPLEDDP